MSNYSNFLNNAKGSSSSGGGHPGGEPPLNLFSAALQVSSPSPTAFSSTSASSTTSGGGPNLKSRRKKPPPTPQNHPDSTSSARAREHALMEQFLEEQRNSSTPGRRPRSDSASSKSKKSQQSSQAAAQQQQQAAMLQQLQFLQAAGAGGFPGGPGLSPKDLGGGGSGGQQWWGQYIDYLNKLGLLGMDAKGSKAAEAAAAASAANEQQKQLMLMNSLLFSGPSGPPNSLYGGGGGPGGLYPHFLMPPPSSAPPSSSPSPSTAASSSNPNLLMNLFAQAQAAQYSSSGKSPSDLLLHPMQSEYTGGSSGKGRGGGKTTPKDSRGRSRTSPVSLSTATITSASSAGGGRVKASPVPSSTVTSASVRGKGGPPRPQGRPPGPDRGLRLPPDTDLLFVRSSSGSDYPESLSLLSGKGSGGSGGSARGSGGQSGSGRGRKLGGGSFGTPRNPPSAPTSALKASLALDPLNSTQSAPLKARPPPKGPPKAEIINQTSAHTPLADNNPFSIRLNAPPAPETPKEPPQAHSRSAKSTAQPLIDYLNESMAAGPPPGRSHQSPYQNFSSPRAPPTFFPPLKKGGAPDRSLQGPQGPQSLQAQSLLTPNNSRSKQTTQKRTVASLLAQSRGSGSPFGGGGDEMALYKDLFKARDGREESGGGGSSFSISSMFEKPGSSVQKTVHRPWDNPGSSGSSSTAPTSILNIPSIPPNVHNSSKGSNSGPDLTAPLSCGWSRETKLVNSSFMGNVEGRELLNALVDPGNTNNLITGQVTYIGPSGIQCRNIGDVKRVLSGKLTLKNFSFNSRLLIGDFLLPIGGGGSKKERDEEDDEDEGDYIRLTAEQLGRWLEETSASSFYEKPGHGQVVDEVRPEDMKMVVAEESEEERLKREIQQQELLVERERKKQHSDLIRAMELHRRAKRRHQLQVERKLRKKMQQLAQQSEESKNGSSPWKGAGGEDGAEGREGVVDELNSLHDLPPLEQTAIKPIKNLHLSPLTFANVLQVYEFLHTFGETLGFDSDSLPTLSNLQRAFLHVDDNEEELLLSIVSHLLVCAVEDPGMGNPQRHMTAFGQTLKQADVSSGSLTEVLRLYLEGIIDTEPEAEPFTIWLKEAPFLALSASRKSKILTFICDLLLQNKALLKFLESSSEAAHVAKKERVANEVKVRRLRMLCARRAVASASLNPGSCSNSLVIDAVATGKDLEGEDLEFDGEESGLGDESNSAKPPLKLPSELPDSDNLLAPTPEPSGPNSVKPEGLEEENSLAGSESETKKPAKKKKRKESPLTLESSDSPQPGKASKSKGNTPLLASASSTPPASVPAPPSTTITSDSESESIATTGGGSAVDPDARLSIEELRSKMAALQSVNERLRKSITSNMKIIRAGSLGQDRWRRRYWNLPHSGGIYVEGGLTGEMAELVQRVKEKEKRREELRRKRKKRMKLLMKVKKRKMEESASRGEKTSEDEVGMDQDGSDLSEDELTSSSDESDGSSGGKSESSSRKSGDSGRKNPDFAGNDDVKAEIKEEVDGNDVEMKEDVGNHLEDACKPEIKQEISGDSLPDGGEGTPEVKDGISEPVGVVNGDLDEEGKKKKRRRKFSRVKFSFKKKRKTGELGKIKGPGGNALGSLGRMKKKVKMMKKLEKMKRAMSGRVGKIENELFDEEEKVKEVKVDPENLKLPLEEPPLKIFNFFNIVPHANQYSAPGYTNSFTGISPGVLTNGVGGVEGTGEGSLNGGGGVEGVVHVGSKYSEGWLVDYNTKKMEGTGCFGKMKEKERIQLSDDDNLVKKIRPEFWNGWWKLEDSEIDKFVDKLCPKGMREAQLKDNLTTTYPGYTEELDEIEDTKIHYALSPEGGWDPDLNRKVHFQLLENLETLEERVASASLQVKGWILPSKFDPNCDLSEEDIIENVKQRLIDLESAIERRYLKPPLGKSVNEIISLFNLTSSSETSTSRERNSANSASSSANAPNEGTGGSSNGNGGKEGEGDGENSKGSEGGGRNVNERDRSRKESVHHQVSRSLQHWRDAVGKAVVPAILSMAITSLDSSIAWDKSVMKASCQLCKGGDHEDKLLLCDACDRGYHTYCFKPPLVDIPDGDWFCWECINKATGVKGCIVCGKQGNIGLGSSNNKILSCDKCVKAFHLECLNPPLAKMPRGRWHCSDHRDLGVRTGGGSRDSSGSKKNHSDSSPSGFNSARKRKSEPKPFTDDSSTSSLTKSPSKPRETVTSVAAAASAAAIERASAVQGPVESPAPSLPENSLPATSNSDSDSKPEPTEVAPVASTVCSPAILNPSVPITIATAKISKKVRLELVWCEKLLDELTSHDDAWPFLEPVNCRQFPTYKKVIKNPIDLTTIRARLLTSFSPPIIPPGLNQPQLANVTYYRGRDGFLADVRLIFDNCETFNEDDSPVGKAGHALRTFYESKLIAANLKI